MNLEVSIPMVMLDKRMLGVHYLVDSEVRKNLDSESEVELVHFPVKMSDPGL